MRSETKRAKFPPIRSERDLAKGVALLREIDPDLNPIIDGLDAIPLRLRAPGFRGIAEIITAQQVSKASATAMFDRLVNLIVPLEPGNLLAAGDKPMIEAGLSRAKQSTLKGLALAITQEELNLAALCSVRPEEAMLKLTSVKGIGPWTADVFLLFCAGHADIFPAGDVALQYAVGDVAGLTEKPDLKTTRSYAARWSPVRGVAARVLYAHYALTRRRSAVPV